MRTLIELFSKLIFLLFGGAVVALSLLSANRTLSHGEGLQLARQQFYLQGAISPDHLLYPAAMAVDRVELLLAGPEQTANLKLEYAWQRFYHAEDLLNRGYHSLSFSTLTKAYKYYNEALLAAQQLPLDSQQKTALIKDSQVFEERVQSLFASFTHDERQELVRLSDQQGLLEQFLIDSI